MNSSTHSTPCPKCGHEKTVKHGSSIKCKKCNQYSKIGATDEIEYGDDFINIVCASPRVLTKDQLLKQFKVDPKEWEVERYKVKTSEGYRKDRSVSWHVSYGKVTSGDVEDSGKMLVVPLYHIQATLRRRTEERKSERILIEFIKQAKKHSPKYNKIKYKKVTSGHLLELGLPDMQLGRMVMETEARFELTPESMIEKARAAVSQIITLVSPFNIERVVFPIGNDFFDANTAEGKTVHNTPMRDDPRWQKTFALGQSFLVDTIDLLSLIAPVDVLVIPGNHDEERIHYMGEVLAAWYRNNPNVMVDNRPAKRKYYHYKNNLIGLTHGYYEKMERLASLMAYEEPQLWAKTKYREWHLGDKHHKKDVVYHANELENGVVVRILRSLSTPSVWEFDKGLVGSLKAGEGFVWNGERGLVAQFTAQG